MPRVLFGILFLAVASSAAAEPPGAPTLIDPPAINGSSVTLRWLPPTSGGVPTHYVLEARLIRGGPVGATVPTAATAFTAPSVPNGTYYVSVYAANPDGRGPDSNTVAFTVSGCNDPPAPPGTLTWSGKSAVALIWGPSPTTGGCAAIGYLVYVGKTRGASDVAVFGTSLTTFSTPVPAGTYYVRVTAFNSAKESGPSNEQIINVTADGITGVWSGSVIGRSLGAQGGPLTYAFVEAPNGDVVATDPNNRFPRLEGRRYGNTLLLDRVDGRNCERWTLIVTDDVISGEARYSCALFIPIWTVNLKRVP